MINEELHLQKGFDCLLNLVTTERTKEKQPNFGELTPERIVLTLLVQMLTGKSSNIAREEAGLIGNIVYMTFKEISALNKPMKVIEAILSIFKVDQGKSMFFVAPTTLNRAMKTLRIEDADRCFKEQNIAIEENLKKKGLFAVHCAVATDPTNKEYRGKYPNQCHPWGYKGQKETYRRGHTEVSVFLQPNQLFVGNAPRFVTRKIYAHPHLPAWIPQIQCTVQDLEAASRIVEVIYGDREYYSGIGMAFAYFGMYSSTNNQGITPRLVVPQKLFNSAEKKWKYLLDFQGQPWEIIEMSVDHYQKDFLGPFINLLAKNEKKTKVMVPIASVAVFDNYPNKNKPKTLEWGHNEALKIENFLASLQEELSDAEEEYRNYHLRHDAEEIKMPKYKGKRRTSFRDNEEMELYLQCYKKNDRIKHWKKEKKKLLKRLMFFAVSLRYGEKVEENIEEICQLIRGYTKRWGIENGFKHLKYHFWIKTNKRGVRPRHVRYIASQMIYNSWHYYRTLRSASKFKKINKKWRKSRDEWINSMSGISKEKGPILSADGYLLELLRSGIRYLLKSYLKQVKNIN